jgi:TetR/AcrR family transcriptional regulator, transcriptional repressor for nem operon
LPFLYDDHHLTGEAMRYAKGHKSETRDRILKSATARLRSRGSAGIAIADLMKESGLTHGGFYAHFKSRDALIDEAFRDALEGIVAKWRHRAERAPDAEKLAAIVNGYLTEQNRDDTETGCVLPALGAEVARANSKTRKVYTAQLEKLIALIAEYQSGRITKAARERAIGTISTMIGSLLMARAVGDLDMSLEILKAGRRKALS